MVFKLKAIIKLAKLSTNHFLTGNNKLWQKKSVAQR